MDAGRGQLFDAFFNPCLADDAHRGLYSRCSRGLSCRGVREMTNLAMIGGRGVAMGVPHGPSRHTEKQ
jgi:hypothetical protein